MVTSLRLRDRGFKSPRLVPFYADLSQVPWTAWSSLIFFVMLLGTTVSAHSGDDVRDQVFSPILPPQILKLGRIGFRLGAIALVVYSLYLTIRSPRWLQSAKLLLPILLFAAMGLISVLWSPLPSISLIQSVTFATTMLWAWFIAISWKSEIDTSRIVSQVAILQSIAAGALVVLHFLKPDVGALEKGAPGIFHSTASGAMSSLSIYLITSSWLIWRWKWASWSMLFVPVHIAAILIGGNRVSVVAAICASGLIYCHVVSRRMLAWKVLIGSLLVLVYFLFDPGLRMIDQLLEKIAEHASQGQSVQQIKDLSGRADMWAAMWDSYLDSPIWGHGYGVTSASGEIFMWGEWGNWTAHNLALQSLTTMGLIGTACLTIGIAILGWNLMIAQGRRVGGSSKHALFLVGAGFWFMVWGLSNETFLGPMQPESLVFALAIGIAAGTCLPSRHVADAGFLKSNSSRLIPSSNDRSFL